ncbi:MAG: transcriptional regulator NrdR [Acidimicrobiia bacterium]|nr:transcriptional regulator NrdR [Acidimicrobiia bacterium]
MNCPSCGSGETKVVDSRVAEEHTAIRRRRQCLACGSRFTTYERVDHVPLVVIKSHGGREPFDRAKVVAGLLSASKGRGVPRETLDDVALRVEDTLRLGGSEVSSATVGLVVLEQLRSIDDVSYLRFASVYKNFDAAADFHRELELLDKSVPAG